MGLESRDDIMKPGISGSSKEKALLEEKVMEYI